jgi:Flp pilus assembly pilin Flp
LPLDQRRAGRRAHRGCAAERSCDQPSQGDLEMRSLTNYLKSFWADESAISSVEYALLLAVIAAGVATTAGLLGTQVIAKLKAACNALTANACP